MAKEVTSINPMNEAPKTEKVKRTRTPSAPKVVYAIVQVMDENGEPMTNLTKAQVKVISFEKSAEKVLQLVESGAHPGALFLRGMLPAGK